MEIDDVVAAYGAAWNEPDAAKRTALLEQSWADDGQYRDPTGNASGRAALIEHIGGFHAMMPGHEIHQASGVDAHGSTFRFEWDMRNGAEVALVGMDFGELAPDGRIQSITGFFGPFPSLDA